MPAQLHYGQRMQSNKLSLVSLVAGAILFALPWIEVQCQGRTFLRQTGLQIAVGSVTIGSDFAKMAPSQQEGRGGAAMGLIVLASGSCLGLALLAAWRNVKADVHELAQVGRYAAIALALVVSQMVFGFPIERGLRDELKKSRQASSGQSPDFAEAALHQQVAAAFLAKPLPSLYLYLAALAVPTVLWLMASSRRERSHSEPATNPL